MYTALLAGRSRKKEISGKTVFKYITAALFIAAVCLLAGVIIMDVHAYPVIMDGQYVEWVYTEEDGLTIISDEPMTPPDKQNAPAEPPEEAHRTFIPFDSVSLSDSLQRLLWDECRKYGIEYAFALGTIQLESDFNPGAVNHNSNGSVDRGICQTNSCWLKTLKNMGMIASANDLFDPATGIRCGMWELGKCVAKYGNTERAYVLYNTGKDTVKSNKASRKVWQYTQEWRGRL